jgi:hypothetical protein
MMRGMATGFVRKCIHDSNAAPISNAPAMTLAITLARRRRRARELIAGSRTGTAVSGTASAVAPESSSPNSSCTAATNR